jgi:hypothetical protein
MQRVALLLGGCTLSALAACAGGIYTRAELVYAEPAQYVYAAPPERVIVVTREVLVNRGYTVYRVEESGPNRVIWARRGDDEVVRVFVNREGERVALRGLREGRDPGQRRHWVRRERADDVITEIDGRMRAERH